MNDDLVRKVKQITYRPKDRVSLFRDASLPEQSVLMAALSPYVQQDLLRKLQITEIINVLDHMDLRIAKRVVEQIKDEKFRTRITVRLKTEIKEKVEYFLRFHPKATMSLVHFNYLLIPQEITIGEVADGIEEHHRETGKFPEVLVHSRGELIGEIPLSTLVRERNNSKVKNFVEPVATVLYTADVKEIVDTFARIEKKEVVVLDEDGSVLGIVYADEALSLFRKMPAESLYDMAGLNQTEQPFDPAIIKFKNRSRWLILNLGTAFMAGSVIFLFESTIDRLAILAVYIPIVAGMGGNAASQTFAVMMRGITLGTVSYRDGAVAVWRETLAGAMNGFLIGFIVATISFFVNGSIWLGVVVALAMIAVHIVAGFFGAITPLVLQRFNKDPATTSMILITTATDVLGFFALLGIGAWLLL
ncbi:MAG: magnesium transporter [Candidatus Paceibacteria bacterium]